MITGSTSRSAVESRIGFYSHVAFHREDDFSNRLRDAAKIRAFFSNRLRAPQGIGGMILEASRSGCAARRIHAIRAWADADGSKALRQ